MAKPTETSSTCDKLKRLSPEHFQLVTRLVNILSQPDVKPAVMPVVSKPGITATPTEEGQQ
jgi:hypothetical protein